MKKNYKKFKLHPIKGDKSFYTVYIFDDRATMRLFSAQIFTNGSNHKFEAVTHSYTAQDSDTIGSILFYKGGFGIGVASHELAHAVNYFFMRKKLKFNMGGNVDEKWKHYDELYAWSLGYVNNQFWKKCGVKPSKERY